jgi:hypothetical protein
MKNIITARKEKWEPVMKEKATTKRFKANGRIDTNHEGKSHEKENDGGHGQSLNYS